MAHDNRRETNGGQAVAWVSMIVGIVALILAWAAFNRAGEDLEKIVEREVEEATVEIRTDLDEAERQLRENTAEGLRDTADDVETDNDPNSAGE